ncbi:RNA-directed DNA polymerase, eukaryota [Tanacetum coccineum]
MYLSLIHMLNLLTLLESICLLLMMIIMQVSWLTALECKGDYASKAGFGVRLSCQKRLKCGYVKTKYLVCNREGCPKEVWLNTLDPKKNDRQVRSSNFRVCGCKARVQFDMVLKTSKFEERQEFTKGFSFDYFVEDAELCGLFWADEVAKCNYIEFGDIVSFDATYKTNKYKMVFVPLNAIDNHKRSVIVGSGLLKRETVEAYGWLLRAFKKAFIRALNIIVIDQDGAMRLAVADEFPESEHRLCIIYDETDFKEKFGKIVWNMFIGPEEFEDKWNKLMEEFNLVNHKWLSKMYRLRSSWIPAFFVDSPLCGLMRTTSRSESENSFFSYFLSSGATLVKFMLCYESAMERQRQTQEKLDHQSFDSFPNLLTPLPIEDHASKVYTRSLFIRVQKEIVAGSWLCSITGMSSDEGCTVCTIDKDKVKPVGFPKEQKNRYGEKNEAIEKLSMEASIILDSCVHMLRNNEPKLSVFVSQMKEIKSKLEAELPIVPNRTVSDFVEEFIGVKKPNQVKVRNPTGVKPKGREKGKRIKSGREISMKKSNKKKSGCGICLLVLRSLRINGISLWRNSILSITSGFQRCIVLDHHGSLPSLRTCPGKDNPDALYPAVLVSGSNDHADGGSRDGSSGSGSV